MEGWRKRLHQPINVTQLQQPDFAQAVSTAVDVLKPSLNDATATSACALIIGTPSCGKSLLTRLVIDELSKQITQKLIVINLNGLLHSTPTRAWQQLYYDLTSNIIMSTTTTKEEKKNDEEIVKQAVQPILDKVRHDNSSLLLILDDIHRFANADALTQTVLYSLLNLLQDRSLRAACIAQTSYIDITDLLEKRVLSRLSHRKIIVPLPNSAQPILQFLRATLLPSQQQIQPTITKRQRGRGGRGNRGRGGTRGRGKEKTNHNYEITNNNNTTINDDNNNDDIPWNSTCIDQFLSDPRLTQTIEQYLTRTRVIAPILRAIDAAISIDHNKNKNNKSIRVIIENGIKIVQDYLGVIDCSIQAILSLTQVQLALLVALRRLECDVISSTKRILFADVYNEYKKLGRLDESRLAETDITQTIVELPIASRAWELLIDGGFIVRTGSGPRNSRPVHCAVSASQVELALDKHEHSSVALKHWAKRTLTRV